MSAAAAQASFTAEFVLFLVAVAGAAFGTLRGELLVRGKRRRTCLIVGFLLVAASALVHGSLLEPDAGSASVTAPRLAGLAAVAWASLRRTPFRRSTIPLLAGLVLLGAAEATEMVAGAGSLAPPVVRIAGAVTVGAMLLRASRRSIAARVAAGAAATVLAVVLAVSVTLSAVLVDNVRDEVLRRTDSRAGAEVDALGSRIGRAETTAASVASLLGDNAGARPVLLDLLDPDPAVASRAAGQLEAALGGLEPLLPQGTVLAYVAVRQAERTVVSRPGDLTPGELAQLPRIDAVDDALASGDPAQGFDVVSGSFLAIAARPLSLADDGVPVLAGLVVAAERIDRSYLAVNSRNDPDVSLAVVDRSGLLASEGAVPARGPLASLVGAVLAADAPTARAVGGRFMAGHPVRAAGRPVAVLVASAPSRLADETRDSLFRTLFLVALAGTLAAIVLASVLGGRLGRALRRLTDAAGQIQVGNLDARVGLDQPDELGILSTAFERMAVSLRTMTDELREAAIDEARLRSRLEAVVGGMGEALVAVDAGGRVIEFNAAAERLFGRAAPTVRGRPVDRLPLVGPGGDDLAGRIAQTGAGAWSGEGTVPTAGGVVPVVVTAAPLRGPTGDTVGAVALFRDMRREREIERMKTEFLSNISHEMKTPLTPIKGYARMLAERDVASDRAREFGTEIAVGAEQLERVIDQLVTFAAIAAGRLEPDPAPVSAPELLGDVVARWSERLGTHHELEHRIDPGTPMLHVDRRLVAMSLDELVDNALKYSPEGGRITLQARAGEEGKVDVSVTDGGVGLDEGRLESIFEDFAQGDASSTRRFGGLGLGLPMVRHVARAHGGDVTVTSATGGTTFTLALPAAPP